MDTNLLQLSPILYNITKNSFEFTIGSLERSINKMHYCVSKSVIKLLKHCTISWRRSILLKYKLITFYQRIININKYNNNKFMEFGAFDFVTNII